MKKHLYMLVFGFSLFALVSCGDQSTQNANQETNPGVNGGGTGGGTNDPGVGTTETPGGLTDVGDTIRTNNTRPPENTRPNEGR